MLDQATENPSVGFPRLSYELGPMISSKEMRTVRMGLLSGSVSVTRYNITKMPRKPDFEPARFLEIQPGSESVLQEIVALLTNNADWELIIEGHTDDVGGGDSNLDLSRERADAVKRWLVDTGDVSEIRLTTVGYGLTRPIADNDSEEGRAQNRRVELVRR